MLMILGLSVHALIVGLILWRACRLRKHRNWLVVIAGCVVFALGVEIYRELQTLRGVAHPLTPARELWFRWVYFVFGVYYNEVFSHVRALFRRADR